jgi:hypothetical protein
VCSPSASLSREESQSPKHEQFALAITHVGPFQPVSTAIFEVEQFIATTSFMDRFWQSDSNLQCLALLLMVVCIGLRYPYVHLGECFRCSLLQTFLLLKWPILSVQVSEMVQL